MNSQLDFVVRPRTIPEVVSLGFLIGKRHFLPLWLASVLGGLLPLLLGGGILVSLGRWELALLLVWWLRPLQERPVLLLLSRLIMNEPWTLSLIGQVYRDSWRGGGIMMALLMWPFNTNVRVMKLAVTLLEGVSGQQKRERLRYLSKEWNAKVPVSTLYGLQCLEVALILTGFFILDMFLPETHDLERTMVTLLLWLQSEWTSMILLLFASIAASIMVVFYVSVAFMMYLNQRVISEGWAVALDLQSLARRLSLVLVMVWVGWMGVVHPAQANTHHPDDTAYLQSIVDNPEVSPFTQRKVPVKKSQKAESTRSEVPKQEAFQNVDWMRFLIIVGLLVLTALVVMVLLRYRWQGGRMVRRDEKQQASVRLGTGQMVELEVVQRARKLLAQGQTMAALALLYRGAIARVDVGLEISDAPTACEMRVKNHGVVSVVNYFMGLSGVWVGAAFAGKMPEPLQVNALIDEFQALWGQQ